MTCITKQVINTRSQKKVKVKIVCNKSDFLRLILFRYYPSCKLKNPQDYKGFVMLVTEELAFDSS